MSGCVRSGVNPDPFAFVVTRQRSIAGFATDFYLLGPGPRTKKSKNKNESFDSTVMITRLATLGETGGSDGIGDLAAH